VKSFIVTLLLMSTLSIKAAVSVSYSEAADVFEIMDHVSLWSTHLSPAIRRHWEKKFGPIGGEDLNMINKYIAIRRKSDINYASYIKETSPEISLFGNTGIDKVPFSMAFYNSKSVGEALKRASPFFNGEDYKFLTSFYKHFLPKIKELVKESTSFKAHIGNYNRALKKVHADKILKRLAAFLGLKISAKTGLKYLVTWWPPEEEPLYEARGNFIMLRYHPLSGAKVWKGQTLLQAGVETFMANMTPNQKSNSAKIFNRHCVGRTIEFNDAMETLWSKVLPEKWSMKKKFTLYKTWHKDIFSDLYTKLLFPLVEESLASRQNIEGNFIHQAATLCAELHSLATPPSLSK
jgi:hypothetical protein